MCCGTEMIVSHFGVKRSKVEVMMECNMLETALLAFTTPLGGGIIITYHLVHGLSVSLPLKFGIPYLFTLGDHNHSLHSDAI